MSDQPKNHHFKSMKDLVVRLRDDFKSGNQDFILLYGYNGTGKTQLSMEFKNIGMFRNILDAFLNKYQFDLPTLLNEVAAPSTATGKAS